MIEDKVLIFYHYGAGINGGGPMGFVNQNIEGTTSPFYTYPNAIKIDKKHSFYRVFINYIKSKQFQDWDIKHDLQIADIDDSLFWVNMLKSAIRKFKEIGANQYKFIYFHDMYTFKACLHLLSKEQVVIFQPHSPEKMSNETKYFSDKIKDIEWANQAERDAFSRADVIVLANKYTKEIYENVINKRSKIKYILSGCNKPQDLRIYPLDNSKINILYIGRRSEIKGFNLLIEAYQKARLRRKDINLLILGNGEKLEGDGIFDIGFCNTPHNWINSVDYVINTNTQSYFDLAVMETLGVGTPIMLTSTEGHICFIEDNSSGVIDIGSATVQNIQNILESRRLIKKRENQMAVEANSKLFTEKYTKEKYLERLNSFCEKIQFEK